MGELRPNEWGGLKVLSSVGSKEYAALAQSVECLPLSRLSSVRSRYAAPIRAKPLLMPFSGINTRSKALFHRSTSLLASPSNGLAFFI